MEKSLQQTVANPIAHAIDKSKRNEILEFLEQHKGVKYKKVLEDLVSKWATKVFNHRPTNQSHIDWYQLGVAQGKHDLARKLYTLSDDLKKLIGKENTLREKESKQQKT